jgi:non-ribosomal peptide synthetase-like protein
MSVGRDCEIRTIIDVVPEHLTIGRACFLADGIYLGGPDVHRGTVRLSPTQIEDGAFIGNHAVIPAGATIGPGVLVGISTIADARAAVRGTSWFGHPPFPLARRAVEGVDRRLTHEPGPIRYLNRVFWEWLRFGIPVVALWVLVAWVGVIALAPRSVPPQVIVTVLAPAVTVAAACLLCLFVLALKWILLGRVSPGEHPLWSCWCSRWDFLYVAWTQLARPFLARLEGTLLLHWYLRAMGATIGRRVLLGAGFAQMVDPDMLTIEDDATVHALFQAHTFEDRVLKIDRVRVGRRSTVGHAVVLLYGAEIGDDATVAPHSVVMKRERLTAGRVYEGCPTRET